MIRQSVIKGLMEAEFFVNGGVYVLVDGQFGSTGKGLAADLLEQYDRAMGFLVDTVTTNAAPNSGHTAVLEDDTKVFTQQIPVFSACRGVMRSTDEIAAAEGAVYTYLNGGAVIDFNYLDAEYERYLAPTEMPLSIHNAAAVICGEVFEAFDASSLDKMASSG